MDNKDKAKKLSSKPNFDRATIFDDNLIAIHMKKTEVYFDKPIYMLVKQSLICQKLFCLIFIIIISNQNYY